MNGNGCERKTSLNQGHNTYRRPQNVANGQIIDSEDVEFGQHKHSKKIRVFELICIYIYFKEGNVLIIIL